MEDTMNLGLRNFLAGLCIGVILALMIFAVFH